MLSFKGGAIIIKGAGAHQYELFYYRSFSHSDGFSAGDTDGDGIPELFFSRFFFPTEGPYRTTEVRSLDTNLAPAGFPESGTPREIVLYQNYPNPFNGTTILTFSLDRCESVTLEVYDILGRSTAVLSSGQLQAGKHTISWNAGFLPSGIYFCRMQTSQKTLAKKMILLR